MIAPFLGAQAAVMVAFYELFLNEEDPPSYDPSP